MLKKLGIAAAIVTSQFVVALAIREMPVFADGSATTNSIPNRLAYNGRIEFDGQPYTGALQVRFNLFDGVGGPMVHSETQATQVNNGAFEVLLGASGDLRSVFRSADDLYLGIEIVGTDVSVFDTPIILQNQQRIVPTAYAFNAETSVDFDVNRDLFVGRDIRSVGDITTEGVIATPRLNVGDVYANAVDANDVTARSIYSSGSIYAEGDVTSASNLVGGNVVVSPSGGAVTDFRILRGVSNGFELYSGPTFVGRSFSNGNFTFDRGLTVTSGLRYLGGTQLHRDETDNTMAFVASDASVYYDITEQICPSGSVMVGIALINDNELLTIPFFGTASVPSIALRPRCTLLP